MPFVSRSAVTSDLDLFPHSIATHKRHKLANNKKKFMKLNLFKCPLALASILGR